MKWNPKGTKHVAPRPLASAEKRPPPTGGIMRWKDAGGGMLSPANAHTRRWAKLYVVRKRKPPYHRAEILAASHGEPVDHAFPFVFEGVAEPPPAIARDQVAATPAQKPTKPAKPAVKPTTPAVKPVKPTKPTKPTPAVEPVEPIPTPAEPPVVHPIPPVEGTAPARTAPTVIDLGHGWRVEGVSTAEQAIAAVARATGRGVGGAGAVAFAGRPGETIDESRAELAKRKRAIRKPPPADAPGDPARATRAKRTGRTHGKG